MLGFKHFCVIFFSLALLFPVVSHANKLEALQEAIRGLKIALKDPKESEQIGRYNSENAESFKKDFEAKLREFGALTPTGLNKQKMTRYCLTIKALDIVVKKENAYREKLQKIGEQEIRRDKFKNLHELFFTKVIKPLRYAVNGYQAFRDLNQEWKNDAPQDLKELCDEAFEFADRVAFSQD